MDDWKRYDGKPLYTNLTAMLETQSSMEALELAMDLVMLAWWPTKAAFTWDEKRILDLLNGARPARGYTLETLRRNMEVVRSFFTVLADGRWTPSSRFFSLVN
jgi:hypothetical protein